MSRIHPTAIVDAGAELADGVEIGPWCRVEGGASLGPEVRLISSVVVEGGTSVGAGTVVHPFAVLGGPPQHSGYRGEPTRLEIGPRNTIREHATLNRGTPAGGGVTRIGADNLFMTGAHVGHDCVVGDRVTFANNATLGGHVVVGDGVFLGGLCAVHQFGRIGQYAMVGGLSAVTRDVIPYGSVWGVHARLEGLNLVGLKRRGASKDQVRRMLAAFRQLFEGDGAFADRLEQVAETYADTAEVREIVAFVREGGRRPLCLPGA